MGTSLRSLCLTGVGLLLSSISPKSYSLDVGKPIPTVELKNQNGDLIKIAENKGKTWTILYFYPKAETPGCTKQACAFRDAVKVIEALNAKVYGVSTDSVKALADFKEHHKLNFELLSDEDGKVSESFGAKMPLVTVSKRYTYLIDPNLVLRHVEYDVDPALDAQKVADVLKKLQ